MEMAKFFPWNNPPDLLRRFVNTPFSATLCLGVADILIQSNDETIFEQLSPTEREHRPNLRTLLWKLVYDVDAPSEIVPPVVITHGSVVIAKLGFACLIAIDSERGELVAFLGISGSDPRFRSTVLPFLSDLTKKALATPTNSRLTNQLVPCGTLHE